MYKCGLYIPPNVLKRSSIHTHTVFMHTCVHRCTLHTSRCLKELRRDTTPTNADQTNKIANWSLSNVVCFKFVKRGRDKNKWMQRKHHTNTTGERKVERCTTIHGVNAAIASHKQNLRRRKLSDAPTTMFDSLLRSNT